jgi:hypothetical protein
MNMNHQTHPWLLSAATIAVLAAFAPALRADWGSIRANNHTAERLVHERRHVDIETERHYAFHWARFRAGVEVSVLPSGYVQASVGLTGYYYYDGVFYQPTTTGTYVVVAPPAGAVVPRLPSGAEAIVVGPTTYYYAGWAYLRGATEWV